MKHKKITKPKQQNFEFGGVWGSLVMSISYPILCIVKAKFTLSQDSIPSESESYFNIQSILFFLACHLIIITLSITPLPAGINKNENLRALYCLVVSFFVFVSFEFCNLEICKFIFDNLVQLLTASIIIAFALLIFVHVRSFNTSINELNPSAFDSKGIYGFFVGRELRPKLFEKLDLKTHVNRISIIVTILLEFAILRINYNVLTTSSILLYAIRMIYYLDAIFTEDIYSESFEIAQTGFGVPHGLGYLIYPFMMASFTRYATSTQINFGTIRIILILTLFTVGYVFFRGSNNQRVYFRRNYKKSETLDYQTIPTKFKDKPLLCSGFWGFVRHPNHLGDILIHLSFTGFILETPAILIFYDSIWYLIYRGIIDNNRCKEKHGEAWDKYCQKVKYVLIPGIY